MLILTKSPELALNAETPSSSNTEIIAARDVYRTFEIGSKPIKVLKGVNLSIERGEKLFLCGASGAGKTSLLYTLAGLEKPNEGSVLVEGVDLYAKNRRDQAKLRNEKMGYVFQNFFLLPELTAIENVLIPAMIGRKKGRDRAEALLDRVGLGDRFNHLPTELSGGEQQRVAIARSLVNDPEIIFADEPTGNLDSKAGRAVMELMMSLADEHARTLVVVTHDSELAGTGDRKIELADGRVVGQ